MRPLFLLSVLLLAGCVAPGPSDPAPALVATTPAVVVGAIGNSLMLGYNADAEHIESAPDIAWATGKEPWSFQARLGAEAVENAARPGAGVETFVAQADELQRATLVLVLLIAHDICPGPPEPGPSADFEDELRKGVRHLHERGMRPMLVTAPDVLRVAEAARMEPPANDFVTFYATAQACAQDPRTAGRQAAMWETVARVAEQEGALHDHGAVASMTWTPDMVSDLDGLHPSPVGLEAIATAVWDAYEATR